MPANTSKVYNILAAELERKLAEAPLELRSVEALFSDEGIFRGTEAFFISQEYQAENADTMLSTPLRSPEAQNTVQNAAASVLEQEPKNSQLFHQISREEIEDIIEKLTILIAMPPGQLDSESELYLEQQLGEVLGLEVSSEIAGHRLLYNTGKVKALPHSKLHPTDTIASHVFPYAQLSEKRSSYGWFLEQGKVSEESEKVEKFFCALPLYFFADWQTDPKLAKKWYKHRKIIFINPMENLAVICAVSSIGPNAPSRYQFGASPETIVAGKFWSPRSSGRALVLFVDDPNDTVQLGPRKLFQEL